MSGRGVRIGNEMLEFIPAKFRIRPLRDQIVVEPLPVDSPVLVECWKPIRGRVLAVGPGCYPLQYRNMNTGEWSRSTPKGQRDQSRESKVFQPCDVKVGDLVELGGKEIGGFLFHTVRWGKREVVLCREQDVCLIVEEQ